MDKVLDFLTNNQWLVATINVLEAIGLIITIRVFFSVKTVKNRLIFKARVPDHIERLSEYAIDMVHHLGDLENSRLATDKTLGRVEAELRNLKNKLSWKHRRQVKELLKEIGRYDANMSEKEAEKYLRNVHLQLHTLVATLEGLQADKEWERVA